MGTRKEQRRQAKQKERQKKIATKTLAERVPEKLLVALEDVDELMFRRKFVTASQILSELAERWPNRTEILNRQVNVYRDLEDDAGVLRAAERWMRLAPNDPEVVAQWCWTLEMASLPGLTTLAIRRFLERWPFHEKSAGLRGIMESCEEQALKNIRSFGGEPNDAGWELLEAHERVFHAMQQHDMASVIALGETALKEQRPISSILNNLAEAYFHSARWLDALRVSQRSVELDPNNLFSQSNVVRFALLLGQRDEANAVADRMRDQRPERFDCWGRMVSAFVMLERDTEALAIADAAQRLIEPEQWEWPEAAELHHGIAVALARQGKTADAETHWRAALKVRPGFPFATQNLDDLRRPVAEQNGPFVYSFENLIPRKMIDALSKTLEKLGRKPSVERQREAAREFNQQCPGVVAAIPLLFRVGDDKAREVASEFVSLFNSPELREALREFAQSDRGTDARRLKALHKLRELGAELLPPVRFFVNGGWKEIRNLEIEITDEPNAPLSPTVRPVMERGRAALNRGDFRAAEQAFRQALKLEPELVSAHNNLAAVVLALDRVDEAEQTLRHVLTLDEDNAIARSNLARMALMNDDEDAAIEWLKPLRTSRRFHTSEYAAMTGVDFELALRKGEIAAAQQLLKSLKEVYPDSPNLPKFQRMLRLKELESTMHKLMTSVEAEED